MPSLRTDYPDHLRELENNTFDFECAGCGSTFDVEVEWDPVFYVNDDSLVLKVPTPTPKKEEAG